MRLVILAVAVGIFIACGGDDGGVGPAALQLVFTVQPSGVIAGQAILPAVQVSVEDPSGHVITSDNSPISLGLKSGSAGATLSGTTTVAANRGVATFGDLKIDRPGSDYTLNASAPSSATGTSSTFDVTPAPGVAATILPATVQSQSGIVGQPVGVPPAVRVTDGLGNPVANVPVTFEVTRGGGRVSGERQITGADGTASIGGWTLGTLAVSNALRATALELQGSPVSFTADAIAGPAAKLQVHGGDGQITVVGTAVGEAPAVRASDIYGNPVREVPVSFRVGSGGGKLVGGVQTTETDGIARVESWTVGDRPGPNTLTASSAGLEGSPVSISATAASGVVVEVRNNYFRSLQNGSGSPITEGVDPFGQPAEDTISRGETVTWVWVGQAHNVSFGAFDNDYEPSGTHNAPQTFSVTFESPGSYSYRCTNHSFIDLDFLDLVGMLGRIVVR
jgi:plastocyanin